MSQRFIDADGCSPGLRDAEPLLNFRRRASHGCLGTELTVASTAPTDFFHASNAA
jgi:hypothetical protein